MVMKTIFTVIGVLVVILVIITSLGSAWTSTKFKDINYMLEKANKNITPELKTMYGLTDEQCEQVYAGIFILYMVPLEDTKRITNFDKKKIKKMKVVNEELRTVLVSNSKELINDNFGSGTVPKKIVDLVKKPSDALKFNEDFRPIADKLISKFKTRETLLRKKIEGRKNYNIVETIIAAMPNLLNTLV
ncbi:hypothetical protein NGRA_2191 [Nosema granulosis]|uniref:Uncharacterized protein n=1 Tax=Nosema granulosis TaxID=83296 RepID=A0A9P6GX48_9MICR|nr:hypothetical protein NGRA_2191 [Nosema granulosis]